MSMQANFPRGGKHLLKEEKTEAPAPKRRKIKKSEAKVLTRTRHRVSQVTKAKHTEVDCLMFQTLREGLLLLGRVKEVMDYKVMVGLPHGLLGTLPITAISPVYSTYLQQVVEKDDEAEDDPTLKHLFCVGDTIQCCVTSVKQTGNKRLVELSTFPDLINKDFPLSALKNGCLLYGAIHSMEEHGCTMDIGLPGIRAFLTSSQQSEEGPQWREGQCLWVTVSPQSTVDVMSGEARVIRVSDHQVVEAEITSHMVSSVECLRPGMKVKATVEKVLKDGLYVRCFKYKGNVFKTHIPESISQYAPGQVVEGRVLFTHPVTKVVSLSLLHGILGCLQRSKELFGGLTIGDIVEEAEVAFVDKTNAVFFRLDGCMALAPIKHLSDYEIKDIIRAFPRGSKHRCRVIGFQPADDMVLVTLKKSVMNQKILSIKDVQPGQIVQCTVEATHKSGVIVWLSRGLKGLIPKMHVADVPLKDFAKKFKKGDKLKCRVLKVDFDAKKVLLTKKKSLVSTSKDIPSSYEGLTPGLQVEGYIIAVKSNGVAVGFCNDVKGWVPHYELSSIEIAHPETAFYQGQVVRCRILSCQPDVCNLRLSFIISGKTAIASKTEKMVDFEPGKIMSATVKRKLSDNLEVVLEGSGTRAVLPRVHLSDSWENQVLLWKVLQVKDVLDSVMLLKQTNLPVVTLKESFLSAAREGLIPQTIQDLQPGQLVPGVVRKHESYGIFVELPGGLGGLAPRRMTLDRPVAGCDLTRVFACGQSVVVKVVEVNEEKGRLLCSLRLCDTYHYDHRVSVEMLEIYLNERDAYLDSVLDSKAEGLKMGSVVRVTVRKMTSDGYICDTPFGMPAVVMHYNIGEAEPQVNTEIEGVVLHIAVDQAGCCLELGTDRRLVSTVSRRKERPTMDRARPGQTIKGVVMLMKDDFVLVALKQHAAGMLALMPRRQHLNDVLGEATSNLGIGEEIKVTIQKCDGDKVIAVLSSLIKEEQIHPTHGLKLGQIVTAHVHSVLPGQMNLKIGDVHGRVHITEVVDEVEHNMFPFAKYTKGQEVKVKIIGFRHFKSFKYLPISHSGIHKALPECTLKPSKLKAEGCPAQERAYTVGDKVPVFTIKFESGKLWVNVTPTQRGVLSVFDLSRDLGLLKNAEKHFTPGHGYMATVLGVEKEGGLFHLSLTGHKEAVKRNKVVTAKVTSVSDRGLAVRLPGDFRGMVPADQGEGWGQVSEGSFIRCLALYVKDKENCVLSLNLLHRSEKELREVKKAQTQGRKRQWSEGEDICKTKEDKAAADSEPSSPKKQRKSSSDVEDSPRKHRKSDSESPESLPVLSDSERGLLAEESITERCLNIGSGFQWDETPDIAADNDKEDDDEDSEEEEEKQVDKKAAKHKKHQAASVTHMGKETPGNKDYARLIASHPNDSRLWIESMVYELSEGRVDSARTLANQALNTITIEKTQEKMNVWVALLNLENLYGTPEDVSKTLQRALQVTDPLKLYRRIAAMYTSAGNTKEAEQTHKTMLRRFKQDRHVWIDYAMFLFKNGQTEAARKLLQRALLSVDRQEHVTTITQFASLEVKHGEAERGFNMLEKVLSQYPKRLDVMAVYTDMAILQGDFHKARELFERSLAIKPSTRLIKKYLNFEEKHGTEETVVRLQARFENESL